jgi:cytochrome o ubiquinol oxidase operon protein cyoD
MNNETRNTESPTFDGYLAGAAMAFGLTLIAFGLVAFKPFPSLPLLPVVAILAVAQMLVHLHWFMHLDLRATPRDKLMVIAFAVVLIILMAGGSIWIMFDLNTRMAM